MEIAFRHRYFYLQSKEEQILALGFIGVLFLKRQLDVETVVS